MDIEMVLTLLSYGQIWGNDTESQLEAIREYGVLSEVTDLAILTGVSYREIVMISGDETLLVRGGCTWTKSNNNYGDVWAVDSYGHRHVNSRYRREGVVRPALQSSIIFDAIFPNGMGYNQIKEVEYGEYPQMAASSSLQVELEKAYQNGIINDTGRSYTFDSRKYDDYDNGLDPVTYQEYEYKEKKYIRIKVNSFYDGHEFTLSNGIKYKDGDYVWVEVSPVRWLIDWQTKTLISKKSLVSGIRYQDHSKKYDGNFDKTEMNFYLNTYMIKDLFQNHILNNKRDDDSNIVIKFLDKIKKHKNPNIFHLIFNGSVEKYIKNVLKIDNKIRNQLQNNENELIKNNDDITKLSLVLGINLTQSPYRKFFIDKGLTIENILNKCGLKIDLSDIENEKEDYNNIEYYGKYIAQDYINKMDNMENFIKTIFNSSINDSNILKDLLESFNESYDILKTEIETGKAYEYSLSVEKRIALLRNVQIAALDFTNTESILNFGSSLKKHSDLVHDEFRSLALSDTHDLSIKNIDGIINRIYVSKPQSKRNFLTSILNIRTEEKSKIALDQNIIDELKETIDSNILNLSNEFVEYHKIREHMEEYLKKNNAHYTVIKEEIEKIDNELKTINQDDALDYARFLELNSSMQIINGMKERFLATNELLKQELSVINLAIVEHYVTINALEMARNILVPLFVLTMSVDKGKNQESKAIDITKSTMLLFKSLLFRNINGTLENMKNLKNLSIDSSYLSLLQSNVKKYVEDVNRINEMKEQLETLTQTDNKSLDKIENYKKPYQLN